MKLVTDDASRVRVLIAEKSELVRRGLRDVLASNGNVVIVGETGWYQEVLRKCADLIPDVVILGIYRFQGNGSLSEGFETLEQVLAASPLTIVIAILDGNEIDDLFVAVRSGARGIILRDTPVDSLREAIRNVLNGDCSIDPRLTRVLFKRIACSPEQAGIPAPSANQGPRVLPPLSPRESEVLYWMTDGLGNKQIAGRLGLVSGTVKTHIAHIFAKLHVDNRVSAVLAGLRLAHSAAPEAPGRKRGPHAARPGDRAIA